MPLQMYMTQTIAQELPGTLQAKIWEKTLRRAHVDKTDYFHIFSVNMQADTCHITHTQEAPVYRSTDKIELNSDKNCTYKIYVIRDETLEGDDIYTMLFANEY